MTVKDKVIQSRLNGYSYSQITREFGIPKSTARDWMIKYYEENDCDYQSDNTPNHKVISYTNDNLLKDKKSKTTKEDIFDFLSKLSPINVNVPTSSTPSHTNKNYVVVMGDMHFPVHCQKSINIVLKTIEELKPATIILNGDTIDMLAISKYPKDIRHSYSLLDERIAYQKFLAELVSVAEGADIIETNANHSGNSPEGRWFRYLSSRIGELSNIPEVVESLSYDNVFLGDFKNVVTSADYVEVCSNLLVVHGDIVRKHGGYSARGMIDRYYQSIMMGHTHRLGMTAQRIPGIGSRPEQQLYAWEMGCLCDLNPVYASVPNWQNGFGIICLSDVDESVFGIEQVLIQNGIANVSTLGKTIVG